MLSWLFNVFIGACFGHKWEVMKQTDWADADGGRGTRFYLRCSKCGEVRIKDPNRNW